MIIFRTVLDLSLYLWDGPSVMAPHLPTDDNPSVF